MNEQMTGSGGYVQVVYLVNRPLLAHRAVGIEKVAKCGTLHLSAMTLQCQWMQGNVLSSVADAGLFDCTRQ